MKISTKLRTGSIIITGLIVIFVGLAMFYILTLQRSQQKQQLAQKITETSFQLALLRSEYRTHPSERPKIQWISMYETQSRLLEEAAPLFSTPEERALFDGTRIVFADSRKLFGELVKSIEEGGNEIITEELSNQLTVKEQSRVFNVLRLSELARAQTSTAQNQFGFITAIFGITIVAISVVFYVMGNSIVRALRGLGENFTRVATLDFSPTTPANSNDELGQLARIFNEMAGKLQSSYATLEQRVRARTQDLEKFRRAVDSSSDHITITDASGTILYANEAVERLTGFSRNEVIGKKAGSSELWGGLMGKDFYNRLWQTVKEKKQPFTAEIRNRRKDGSQFISHASIFPILDDGGGVVFFVEVHRDITKEKEVDKAKTEFVSLASHQLRTPLATINWYVEILQSERSGKINAEQKKYLAEIARGNQRMVDLVSVLLDISRLELGTFSVEPRVTDIVKLTREVIQEVTAQNQDYPSLEEDYQPEIPSLYVDPNLLRIVVSNLITNALKYTPKAGAVNVRITTNHAALLISVSDTGMGIPHHQQAKIFTKLFRADNAKTHDTIGTGLGLYIVKSILDRVGGKIWFKTQEGKGTTFYVSLPLSGMEHKDGLRQSDS